MLRRLNAMNHMGRPALAFWVQPGTLMESVEARSVTVC
jgi:hypothetical protein